MTIGTQDMELIKREMAGIRDFYQSRMDAELTPQKGSGAHRVGIGAGAERLAGRREAVDLGQIHRRRPGPRALWQIFGPGLAGHGLRSESVDRPGS